MSVVYATGFLYDAVVADFAANAVSAPMFFGWREPNKHKRTPWRVVWTPGDTGGSLGSIAPARMPGNNPRTLATLRELSTVRIETYDATNAENERVQYQSARGLYDLWFAAVHRAAHGKFTIVSQAWDTKQNERRHGAAIVVVMSVDATLPDVKHGTAPVDTQADIDTSLQDVTEPTVKPV